MKLQKCSLFIAVVGAFLLTAAFAPTANATLIVYYNFEDQPVGSSNVDYTSVGDLGTQHPLFGPQYHEQRF